MMMLDIFLPETYKQYRIIPKTIAGFYHTHNTIYAAITRNTKNGTEVLHLASAQFSSVKQQNEALAKLTTQLPTYDYARLALSSAHVIFKEITLPIHAPEKIRLVFEYEVESLLPFALEDAILDFIITHQDKESSTILVAAVLKKEINAVIERYTDAGINPTQITIDLFSLFDVYHHVPSYAHQKGAYAIVNLGWQSTRLALIVDDELRLVRNMQHGMEFMVEHIKQKTQLSADEIIHLAHNNGIRADHKTFQPAFQEACMHIFNEIQFTLNTFSMKLELSENIQQLLWASHAYAIPDFISFAQDTLEIPCTLFDVSKLSFASSVNASKQQKQDFVTALGTSMPTPQHSMFNLRRGELAYHDVSRTKKRISAALVLMLGIFIMFGMYGYIEIGRLLNTAHNLEHKNTHNLRTLLREAIKNTNDAATTKNYKRALSSPSLTTLFKRTKGLVNQEETSWNALQSQQLDALPVLLELTHVIKEAQTPGVTIKIVDMPVPTADAERKMEVQGTLKSGTGEDFQEFGRFEQKIITALNQKGRILSLVLPSDSTQGDSPNSGVKFTLTFKQKAAP